VPLGRGQSLQPFVKLQKNDYKFQAAPEENRDGTVVAGGLAFRLPLAQRGSFVVTYEGGREETDGVNWENTFHRVEAALRVPFEKRWVFRGTLEYLLQDYANTHTLYTVRRDDDAWTLQAGLSYQLWKQATFHADVAHVRQNSNIAVYDYSRTIYSVGLSWRF
jgi:predicted porin